MGGKGFIVLPSLQLLLPLLCPNRPHSNFAAAAKQATINPPRPRDWRVCIQMRARDLRGSPQPANDPARRKRPPPSSSLLQVPRERRARPEVAAALIGRCRRRRRRRWPVASARGSQCSPVHANGGHSFAETCRPSATFLRRLAHLRAGAAELEQGD